MVNIWLKVNKLSLNKTKSKKKKKKKKRSKYMIFHAKKRNV